MDKTNLAQRLLEVRKAVPYLKKEKQGYQFKYVSSSQTLGALRYAMDHYGVLLVPRVVKATVTDHTTAKEKHEFFTCLDMEFTWINVDDPTDTLVCPWYGQGLDSGEKGVGKAMTYSEKFFLLKFFNIATDAEDPDSFQGEKPKRTTRKRKDSQEQAEDRAEGASDFAGREKPSGGGTTGKTDAQIREEIGALVLEYSQDDKELAKETLQIITSFKGKDGSMVSGVYSTRGMSKWSRQRLEIAHRETIAYVSGQ